MQNGVAKILSLAVIACLLGSAAALAAPEASTPVADGMFDALQRDMLVLKNRLGLMISAIPRCAGDRPVSRSAPHKAA